MKQSRKRSLVEALVNTGAGFIVGMLLNAFVLPIILNIPPDYMSFEMAAGISLLYGGTSVVRTFILRRWFNNSRWQFWK